jgi:glycosyltransferase involved in cell wall biosynthesis
VLYFEEPVFTEDPVPELAIRVTTGISILTPRLPRIIDAGQIPPTLKRLLDDHIATEEHDTLIAWYYTPMALQFTGGLRPDACVYDNMDELSAFRGASPLLIGLETELLKQATVVFTGGRALFEAKRHRHSNIHAFPSSIDFEHFAQALAPGRQEPADQRSIPQPRIGFFGVIDERMDLDLVARAAALRPDWQFVMLGPVAKIEPSSLPQAANIHWLGQKSYTELPAYLGGWQLGFMPFALNEATRFISPTKTPEFLAAGLRVLSTAIPDVVQPYEKACLVTITSGADDFVSKAEKLLLAPPATEWREKVTQFLRSNSWDLTWAHIDELIRDSASQASRRVEDTYLKEKVHV